ncbi:hypothetical protein H0A36_24655 [Endozoicomonas sp. SM1973]|uniref:Uncharacterized protein n=1 Tax=Spartinivicinus marinus TaxID=2994442 RepID=A0A853I7B6_9GAMM|nr:hypothetical protein [Spartinivicinus marinus]MCX4027364.1 hypothetical protein [Spartinivicinus marinus]NYZ69213.1 hypothetical protein [Spartinivicinus marinus]
MLKIINNINMVNEIRRKSDTDVSSYQLTQEFKENPNEFLKKNLLLINNEPTHVPIKTGVYNFQIEPLAGKHAVDHNGKKINCCLLKQIPEYSKSMITAYFLAYKQDGIESIKLGDDADLFLSAGLTGCGLAIESTSSPQVFHIDGEKYPNDKMLDSLPDTNKKRLYNDATYGNDHYYGGSSAIGVRDGSSWKFFGQAWYMKNLDSYQLAFREGTFLI